MRILLNLKKFTSDNMLAVSSVLVLFVFALVTWISTPIQEYLDGVKVRFSFASGWPDDARISPDGRTLAITRAEYTEDKPLLIFDLHSGASLAELDQRGRPMLFSPDGSYLAMGWLDREIILWDTATWQISARFPIEVADALCGMAYSPDSKFLLLAACGGNHSGVQIIDVTTQQPVRDLVRQSGGETTVVYSPDGQHIMTTYTPYFDGIDQNSTTVLLWDSHTLSQTRSFNLQESVVQAAWLPNTTSFITVPSNYGDDASSTRTVQVSVWNTSSGQRIRQLEHEGPVYQLAVSQDGSSLALGGRNAVELWNIRTWQKIGTVSTSEIRSLDFNPDGTLLAVTALKDQGNSTKVYDISEMLKRSNAN